MSRYLKMRDTLIREFFFYFCDFCRKSQKSMFFCTLKFGIFEKCYHSTFTLFSILHHSTCTPISHSQYFIDQSLVIYHSTCTPVIIKPSPEQILCRRHAYLIGGMPPPPAQTFILCVMCASTADRSRKPRKMAKISLESDF